VSGGRRQRNGGNANGRELVARVPDRCDITVIGDEPHPSYNRILLSSVLADERPLAEIGIQPFSWYEKHGIHSIAATTPLRLTSVTRRVALADGATVPYDKLLLATGSKPLAPQFRALTFANVRAFRDIADVEAMIEAARNHRRAAACSGSKRRGD
jgi:nitrite reductase [NAD(P)H] large subunit